MLVLYIVLAVFGLPFLIALFTRKDFEIERSIVIEKSADSLFNYLKYSEHSREYSKWVMADPDLRIMRNGIDGETGFIFAWDSDNNQVGRGEQEIIELIPSQKIGYEIRFTKPFKSVAHTQFQLKPITENQTEVTWAFQSSMNYPMNFMLLLKMDKMLANDLAISLENLKLIQEDNPN